MSTNRKAMDGMTAAAWAAYALSDAAMIFPITPASHMAETVESWASAGKKNLMGQTVTVREMQSEKGVAGAVHGCLAGGALTSTFTASQGLLLMTPNMYKISGEMLPGVFHVTCRSLAAHALSIFGDHQDLMAVRQTGFAMLGSSSVQECMDLSLVAHLSAIDGSLPFVHFFDGFRTSDEIDTIEPISFEDMGALVNWDKVHAFRQAALEPEHPHIRGTAQNPDVYFQNREATNRFYDALPAIVQTNMDRVAKLTGRSYHLFDYVGAPDAERVIITMASSCDVVEEAVRHLTAQGEKVGLVKVRLYRPFSAEHLLAAIPATARVLCTLDRSKEPGSQGEALFQDVCTAVLGAGRDLSVIGGRYGLSSKDFTPAMAKAVFDEMAKDEPKRHFTVGIDDDLTHLSIPVGPELDTLPATTKQCIFYGFGSDGTVGANKQAALIIGNEGDKYVQGYSWFDSKKSGGLTISYLRFADEPIHSPYLISHADYIACHKSIYVKRGYPMADALKDGGVFVLNCPWSADELDRELPAKLRRTLAAKHARLYTIDASAVAASVGLGHRINMIMQAVFFKLSEVMDYERAITLLKEDVKVLYAAKGQKVVDQDLKAIDEALAALTEVKLPASWAQAEDAADSAAASAPTASESSAKAAAKAASTASDASPAAEGLPFTSPTGAFSDEGFIDRVFTPLERLEGDALPVSALNPTGFVPLGTAAHEKRCVAFSVPRWDVHNCIQCFQCSLVCPHGAIRPYEATDEELQGAPESFETKDVFQPALKGLHHRIQVYPEDCVGCGSCAANCPAPGKALFMEPLESQLATQKENLAWAQKHVSLKDELMAPTSVVGTQLQQPLLEFSGACAGCGETPYVKLLTQLFGDRLIMANATGCSSIWGAYLPSMPYTTNKHGHGPAWGNSLFEDNGEYGFGIARAVSIRRERLVNLVNEAIEKKTGGDALASAFKTWLTDKDDPAASYADGQTIRSLIGDDPSDPLLAEIARSAEMFGKKSVWAVGGDGWAFDIDSDGLDAVLASGENINVLVLDTEGYSNTGGEESKATELGSVSGFSLDGKPTPRKNLGEMMMSYGYVYVAQVSLGANMQQCIDAFHEAESYDGPSLIVALCPCISWGIRKGMSTAMEQEAEAVRCGYWPIFRFNPTLAAEGKDPLTIDYKEPDGKLEDFLSGQSRFESLMEREPSVAKRLHSELAKDVVANFEELSRTVEVYRPANSAQES